MNTIICILGVLITAAVVYWACKSGSNAGSTAELLQIMRENGDLKQKLGQFEQEKNYLAQQSAQLETEKATLIKACETQFENMAHKIFKEHISSFHTSNKEAMEPIVASLTARLADFNQKIDAQLDYNKKAVEASKNIQDLTVNFVNALRGDLHQKGAWGEGTVRKVLTDCGLKEGINFFQQATNADDKKRPDFIVSLPNGQVVIIDSKTIYKHYDDYMHADGKDKDALLQEHLKDVRNTISALRKKNYHKEVADICTKRNIQIPADPISLVLMFVNPEAALTCALEHDPEIIQLAREQKVALVSLPTLISTLQIIDTLWTNHDLQQNHQEIKRLGEELLTGFGQFLAQYISTGKKLHEAAESYDIAASIMGKDKTQGLIAKAQALVELGAGTPDLTKTDKRLISHTGFDTIRK